LFEKSRIFSDHDEVEKSIQTLLTIIDIDSTSHVAYGNIGWNYYLLENYEECIKWSEKAISIDKEALYAMYNIALAYLCMDDFEKSKELYKKYYQLNIELDEPIREGAIQDLKDLIEKGSNVEKATYILKNIFKTEDI
jgi:tetratricopeptide (TPR) repeat protein